MSKKIVSVAEVAKANKVPAVKLRRRLRDAGVRKPGDGWAWPVGHKDLKQARDLARV